VAWKGTSASKVVPHRPLQYRHQAQDHPGRRTDVTLMRFQPHQCHISTIRPDRATPAISSTGRTRPVAALYSVRSTAADAGWTGRREHHCVRQHDAIFRAAGFLRQDGRSQVELERTGLSLTPKVSRPIAQKKMRKCSRMQSAMDRYTSRQQQLFLRGEANIAVGPAGPLSGCWSRRAAAVLAWAGASFVFIGGTGGVLWGACVD